MAIKKSNHKIVLTADDRTKLAVSQAEARVGQYNRQLRQTEKSLKTAFDPKVVAVFAGAVGFTALATQVTALGDAYTKINEKVNLGNKTIDRATANETKLISVREKLLKISNETFSALDSNASAYQKVSFAVQRLGKDSNETLKIIELVNKSLQIGGATETETRSTNLQFSQALASDRLGGDEYRSVLENAPRLIKAISDGLDVSLGKLKEMAAEGELTADVVLGALATQAGEIDEEFSNLSLTIDRAQQQWKNNLTEYIGQANSGIGVNKLLAQSISLASNNIDVMAGALGILVAVMGGKLVGAISAYLATQIKATQADIAKSAATTNLTKAEVTKAASLVNSARLSKAAAAATVIAANADLRAAKDAASHTVALNALTVAQARNRTASVALATAKTGLTTATVANTAATGAASLAARGFSAILALLGGKAGAVILASFAVWKLFENLEHLTRETDKVAEAEKEHKKVLEEVKKAAYEYAEATDEIQKQLKKESKAAIRAAESELKLMEARLEAAKALVERRKIEREGVEKPKDGEQYSSLSAAYVGIQSKNNVIEAEFDLEKQNKLIDIQLSKIETLRKGLSSYGKSKEEVENIFKTDDELFAQQDALDKKVEAQYDRRIKKQKELADAIRASVNPHIEYNKKIKERKELVASGLLSEQDYIKEKAKLDKQLQRELKTLKEVTGKKKEKVDQDERAAKSALAAADPQEQYNQSLDKYDRYLKKGIITGDQYNVLVTKAKKKLAEATKEKKKAVTEEERYQKQIEEAGKQLAESLDPYIAYTNRVKVLDEYLEKGAISQRIYNLALAEAKKTLADHKTDREKYLEQLFNEGKQLTENLDPQAAYNASIKEYDEYLKQGAISQDIYNKAVREAKKALAETNEFQKEQNKLLAERDLIGKNPIDAYREELEKSGDFKTAEIDILVDEKQLNVFRKVKAEIIAQGKEAGLTEAQYIRLKLALEGLTPAQVEFNAKMIESNKKMSEARQLNQTLAESLENDIKSSLEDGKISFKNFGDAIIAEIMRMYAYKPLLDALFGQKTTDGGRVGGVLTDLFKNVFSFANGGVMTPNGAIPLNAYATGWVASSPQLASFGEGRQNEAFVPLPDGKMIPVTLNNNGVTNLNQTVILENKTSQNIETANPRTESNGDLRIDLITKRVETGIAHNVSTGDSPLIGALSKKLR